jgi:glycosyltransferase involved in cell wall biosynthesis
MSRTDVVALVWAPHEARTASFAAWLNAPLYNIHYLGFRRPIFAPFKYPLQWIKTWYEMLRVRPHYIYVTNSPPVAGLCVYFYCLLTRTRYIMDTHTPNLYVSKWRWTQPLQRFLARHATMNIVDQEKVKQLFESWGAKVMVLENPPKDIPQEWLTKPDPDGPVEFTYVGTLVGDEPVEILIDAARQLPHIKFYILGDKGLAKREWIEQAPENAVFTGYLLKDQYWGRLSRSRGIIALTKHTFSLSGAGQDGVHINKPVILSDQPPLRLHFTKGTVFVDNTTEGMVQAIKTFLENEERLKQEIVELHQETSERWQRNFQRLKDLVTT